MQDDQQEDGSDGDGDSQRYDQTRRAAVECSLLPTLALLVGTARSACLSLRRFLSLSETRHVRTPHQLYRASLSRMVIDT